MSGPVGYTQHFRHRRCQGTPAREGLDVHIHVFFTLAGGECLASYPRTLLAFELRPFRRPPRSQSLYRLSSAGSYVSLVSRRTTFSSVAFTTNRISERTRSLRKYHGRPRMLLARTTKQFRMPRTRLPTSKPRRGHCTYKDG
jgi:hypothetical protein